MLRITHAHLWNCSQNNFVAIVDLPEGDHQYKFSVDGHWMLDPNGVSGRSQSLVWRHTSTADTVLACQAVATSKTGVVNNTIQVKRTDFEVFDALRIDSEDSADFSGCTTVIALITLASHCYSRST